MISVLSYFKTHWIAHIAVAIALSILITLGFWQLHRFHEKRALETKFAEYHQSMPLKLKQIENSNIQNYQPIQLEGYFDNVHSFLLDNQFYQHRLGYQVITPLIIPNNSRIILINRGWIPQNHSRNQLPHFSAIREKVKLTGLVYLPQKNPFISNELETITWPQRIQSIDFMTISKRLNHPIYPWIILLDPKNSYGFVRNWQPTTLKSSMHIGYAIQWFLMATILLVIYFNTCIKRKN